MSWGEDKYKVDTDLVTWTQTNFLRWHEGKLQQLWLGAEFDGPPPRRVGESRNYLGQIEDWMDVPDTDS